MGLTARRLEIRGRVQGVGFRAAAVHAAFELGVQGWVRNHRDGHVEVLVQGEPARWNALSPGADEVRRWHALRRSRCPRPRWTPSLAAFETRATI